jgi:hypothetical protein
MKNRIHEVAYTWSLSTIVVKKQEVFQKRYEGFKNKRFLSLSSDFFEKNETPSFLTALQSDAFNYIDCTICSSDQIQRKQLRSLKLIENKQTRQNRNNGDTILEEVGDSELLPHYTPFCPIGFLVCVQKVGCRRNTKIWVKGSNVVVVIIFVGHGNRSQQLRQHVEPDRGVRQAKQDGRNLLAGQGDGGKRRDRYLAVRGGARLFATPGGARRDRRRRPIR